MEALTVENIIKTFSQINQRLHPHTTTIVYIQTLLEPYVSAIKDINTNEGIVEWIPRAFSGELAKHAMSGRIRNNKNYVLNDDDPALINAIKIDIIEYLVAELAEISGISARDNLEGYIILPWDVQGAISKDGDFSKMLGITEDQNQLMITVTIGANQFVHPMTIDLAMGLLLFSDPSVGNVNYQLSLFGSPFAPGFNQFMDPKDKDGNMKFRYIFLSNEIPVHTYSVTVGGIIYGFNDVGFMQGISTGATWLGVDHHNYWSDLLLYQQDKVIRLTFLKKIIFV